METIFNVILVIFILNCPALPSAQQDLVAEQPCLGIAVDMKEWITATIDKHESADVVLLDFTKAYDSMNREIVLTKVPNLCFLAILFTESLEFSKAVH